MSRFCKVVLDLVSSQTDLYMIHMYLIDRQIDRRVPRFYEVVLDIVSSLAHLYLIHMYLIDHRVDLDLVSSLNG